MGAPQKKRENEENRTPPSLFFMYVLPLFIEVRSFYVFQTHYLVLKDIISKRRRRQDYVATFIFYIMRLTSNAEVSISPPQILCSFLAIFFAPPWWIVLRTCLMAPLPFSSFPLKISSAPFSPIKSTRKASTISLSYGTFTAPWESLSFFHFLTALH